MYEKISMTFFSLLILSCDNSRTQGSQGESTTTEVAEPDQDAPESMEELKGFLKKGLLASRVVAALGTPDEVVFDNGSGPYEGGENELIYLWTYAMYPKSSFTGTLIIEIRTSDTTFSQGDSVVGWTLK
jgi:hypothetical protein